jgi:hypothetical protein
MELALRRGQIPRDVWWTFCGLRSALREQSALISMLHLREVGDGE